MQTGNNTKECVFFLGIYFDAPVANNCCFYSKFAQAETFDLAVVRVIDWAKQEGLPNIRNIRGRRAFIQNPNEYPFPEEVLN